MSVAEYVESALLSNAGFRHAFFTRRGGVSEGPYESLNFSITVGDEPENVRENLNRAAAVLSVEPAAIYYLSQVHGPAVHVLTGREDPRSVLLERADALVATAPAVACGIRSADCVPVLIGDRKSGAVAALHAGWRGAVCGIVSATIERLRAAIGARGTLVAAIGPHISERAFEVSPEVAAEIVRASPDPNVVLEMPSAKPRVNLRRVVRAQLEALGLTREQIDDVPGCTFTDQRLFFSYRRDGQQSGRHLSAIVAPGA